jgi:predicted ATPase
MEPTRPWYVLTGGPCAGKTTLIEALGAMGYKTMPEAARAFIEQELAKGRTIEEIRADKVDFQHRLLPMKLEAQKALLEDEVVFFDRGMHDTIAYLAQIGVHDDEKTNAAVAQTHYQKVFVLDRLPLEYDGARTETSEEADEIDGLLFKVYEESGIPTMRVPVMPIEDRIAFIFANIDMTK